MVLTAMTMMTRTQMSRILKTMNRKTGTQKAMTCKMVTVHFWRILWPKWTQTSRFSIPGNIFS